MQAQNFPEDPCLILSDSICTEYIELMSTAGQDEVPALLDYWEFQCGVYEPQIRARLLYVIALNAYEPTIWDSVMYEEADYYESRMKMSRLFNKDEFHADYYNDYGDRFGYVKLFSDFDSFTVEFARRYLQYSDLKYSERVLLNLYAGNIDEYYTLLQTDQSDSNLYVNLYRQKLDKVLKIPDEFLRIGLGVWSPGEEAEILGTHPSLHLDFGQYHQRRGWEVDFELRFLKSRDSFDFENSKVNLYTDRFSGWALNWCYSLNLSKQPVYRLNLKAGVGWDALAISVEESTDTETYDRLYWASSPSAILGLEWTKRTNFSFWTVGYTRHFMDYSMSDRTSLSGFAHSVRVLIGFIGNDVKTEKLTEMHANPWIPKD